MQRITYVLCWLLLPATALGQGVEVDRQVGVIPQVAKNRISVADFELIGGWRVRQPFTRPGLAIDFERRRVFAGGHAQKNEIHEYALTDMGTGENVNDWPILERVATHERFWERGSPRGMEIREGVLWISPKVFYDTKPGKLTISGKDLETGEITKINTELSQPGFGGGFIKGHSQWLLGCGGYESGQGGKAGPTAATINGDILLDQANHGTMVFEDRELRPANYWVRKDSWIALNPRDGIGRWACDRIHGGGVWHPRGLMFWAFMGTGELLYKRQNETFGKNADTQNWLYSYDPETFDQVTFEPWPYGKAYGYEVGPDGLIYVQTANEWKSASYNVDAAIKVFRVKE